MKRAELRKIRKTEKKDRTVRFGIKNEELIDVTSFSIEEIKGMMSQSLAKVIQRKNTEN